MFTPKLMAAMLGAALLVPGAAFARDQIQLSGSSTVLPYATIAAEAFGQNTNFKTPVVEGGGTGAGIAKFCEGVGEGFTDIASASRKMKTSEKKTCAANGVTAIQEVRIGYDGVVFASDINGPAFEFTPSNWYNALAAEVVVNGALVPNPYTNWSQIDGNLPNEEILAFIPGSKHGTREVFDQKVIQRGCGMFKADKAFKARDGKADGCIKLRTDGHVVEIDGDYTETLARLKSNKNGVGVFGLSFYENNTDTLQVSPFQGVVPSRETVASGKYSISRPLFIYVKSAHVGVIPGLQEFVQFFVSDDIAGPNGPLAAYGLVADPALASTQAAVAN
jgi:phosphate transport system substrate-binding protein